MLELFHNIGMYGVKKRCGIMNFAQKLDYLMEKQGITEELKACDQKEWVRAVK